MKVKPLTEGLFESAQIDPQGVPELASKYATIVSNRPDGDGPGEPASVVADAARPILALCRTGSRSTHLWTRSEAGKHTADEILNAATSAGCELSQLKHRLEAAAASQ